jgi:hypothetical protein
MEFLQYEINEADTLEFVSQQHNQRVEQIVSFHNQHCGITQQIIGNTFPVYLKFLYKIT